WSPLQSKNWALPGRWESQSGHPARIACGHLRSVVERCDLRWLEDLSSEVLMHSDWYFVSIAVVGSPPAVRAASESRVWVVVVVATPPLLAPSCYHAMPLAAHQDERLLSKCHPDQSPVEVSVAEEAGVFGGGAGVGLPPWE